MCRVYNTKHGPFVRLCYRFGTRRGEKVHFQGPAPISGSGHYNGGEARQGRRRRERAHALSFSVTTFTNQHVVDDMARYAGATATWDQENQTVTLFSEKGWKNTRPIVERAATFGWHRR